MVALGIQMVVLAGKQGWWACNVADTSCYFYAKDESGRWENFRGQVYRTDLPCQHHICVRTRFKALITPTTFGNFCQDEYCRWRFRTRRDAAIIPDIYVHTPQYYWDSAILRGRKYHLKWNSVYNLFSLETIIWRPLLWALDSTASIWTCKSTFKTILRLFRNRCALQKSCIIVNQRSLATMASTGPIELAQVSPAWLLQNVFN